MKHVTLALAATLFLAISSCTGQPPAPVPTVTATVTATIPKTTPTATELAACDYGPMGDGQMALVISAWDLVKASRGASDHPERIETLTEYVKNAQESETKGCQGSAESAGLVFEVAILNADVNISGEAERDDYTKIVAAGNAWFDASGYTEHRFSMGENDLGI